MTISDTCIYSITCFFNIKIYQIFLILDQFLSLFITSNDRSFGCPIISTEAYSQCCLVHGYLHNAWDNKAHSLTGKPYLAVIASNVNDRQEDNSFHTAVFKSIVKVEVAWLVRVGVSFIPQHLMIFISSVLNFDPTIQYKTAFMLWFKNCRKINML